MVCIEFYVGIAEKGSSPGEKGGNMEAKFQTWTGRKKIRPRDPSQANACTHKTDGTARSLAYIHTHLPAYLHARNGRQT